jgi:hypothetical protein
MILQPVLSGGGTKLPTLTNPGSASDLLSGKQLIAQDGSLVTGTYDPPMERQIPCTNIEWVVSGENLYLSYVTTDPAVTALDLKTILRKVSGFSFALASPQSSGSIFTVFSACGGTDFITFGSNEQLSLNQWINKFETSSNSVVGYLTNGAYGITGYGVVNGLAVKAAYCIDSLVVSGGVNIQYMITPPNPSVTFQPTGAANGVLWMHI